MLRSHIDYEVIMSKKMEGNGTWTLFNGKKFVGIWNDNRRWNAKSFDEEGKEIGKFVNGEEEIYYKPPF